MAGLVSAIVVAVAVPVASFAISAIGAKVPMQPLIVRPEALPSQVFDDHGNLIGTFSDADYTNPVPLSKVPPVLEHAVLDAEDHNYFVHGPIDVRSIARAAENDILHSGSLQGGSTITQQVVKNEVLTPQRTISRKITELIDSYRISNIMTKKQILERYLNSVYFGRGAYGVDAAVHVYFNEPLSQVTAAQAALLAGLIRNPTLYDPLANPINAKNRRQEVLSQMVQYHDLSASAAKISGAAPLPTTVNPPATKPQNPFITAVQYNLEHDPEFSALGTQRDNAIFKGGLKIYTSFDATLQSDADKAVADNLPNTHNRYTVAMVVMDPKNGYVRAIESGNPDTVNGYDVATGYGGASQNPGRPTGSTFKPIVLLDALQKGIGPNTTVDGTAPCDINGTQIFNAEGPGGNIVSLNDALVNSINCAYIHLGMSIGLQSVVDTAHALGVTNHLDAYPDLSIGVEDITPLQMASVYSTIDDDGVYHKPMFVEKVTDFQGHVLYQGPTPGVKAATKDAARETAKVMEGVITSGTATDAAIGRPAAGKTGTGENYRDAWFIGFVPQLVTAVWMGDPKSEADGMTSIPGYGDMYGNGVPALTWRDFMLMALKNQPVEDFPNPSSVPPSAGFLGQLSQAGESTSTTTTSTTDASGSSTSSTTSTSAGNGNSGGPGGGGPGNSGGGGPGGGGSSTTSTSQAPPDTTSTTLPPTTTTVPVIPTPTSPPAG